MLKKRKFLRIINDPTMQGPFAWPFKVLRDLFIDPPFVADPEFVSLDMDALRGKWIRKASHPPETPTFPLLNVERAQFIFLIWFLELILLPLVALIILS